MYLSSLAIDDKAREHTLPRLAFKHAGAAVDVVAKVNSGHGHRIDNQAAFRCLKGVCMMEGEEGSGLKNCMRLAACMANKTVAVNRCSIQFEAAVLTKNFGVSALVNHQKAVLKEAPAKRSCRHNCQTSFLQAQVIENASCYMVLTSAVQCMIGCIRRLFMC